MPDTLNLSRDIPLPLSETCATWCADAKRALQSEPEGFQRLLQNLAAALRGLAASANADAAAWIWDHPWRTPRDLETSILTVFLSTDAAATREHLQAFQAGLGDSKAGWVASGVRQRPGDAMPLLALVNGQLFHTWQDRDEDYAEYMTLRWHDSRIQRVTIRPDNVPPALFLDGVPHAIGQGARTGPRATAELERLKIAYAMRVAKRIVAADGIVDSDEKAFLAEAFPEAIIEVHALASEEALDQAADEAEACLKARLGYHEKLALLNTFYASCAADGHIDVSEVKVLREAAATLGLSHGEVVGYLARVW